MSIHRVALVVVSFLILFQHVTFLSYAHVTRFALLESIPLVLPKQTTASPDDDVSIHQKNISILPLSTWEDYAMENLKRGSLVCHAPKGVQDTCCPGSFSRGGEIIRSNQCSHADYETVEELARQFVDSLPTPTNEGHHGSCDICRIVEILREMKESLTVLGDSVMFQAFDGLHCELLRRNYIVDKKESIRKNWDKGGFGKMKSYAMLLVRSPLWPQHEVARIQMFFTYTVPFVIQEDAEEFNNAGGILWFNFGLHDYGDEHELPVFQKKMTSFFSTIRENATFSHVFFRETSAQHFDIPGGMYQLEHHRGPNCTALEWTKYVGNRDRAVRGAALAAGYEIVLPTEKKQVSASGMKKNKMVVLPFHNFTALLHGNHPYDPTKPGGECTHFCSTPFLWMPLWKSLRTALDTVCS